MDIAICVLNKNDSSLWNDIKGKIFNVDKKYEHKNLAVGINETIQKAIDEGYKSIAVCDGFTIPTKGLENNTIIYGQNVSLKTFTRNQFNPDEVVRMEPCCIVLSSDDWIKIGGFRNLSGSVIKNIKDIIAKKRVSLTIYKSVPRINANFLDDEIESSKEYVALKQPAESPINAVETEKKSVKKTTGRKGSLK